MYHQCFGGRTLYHSTTSCCFTLLALSLLPLPWILPETCFGSSGLKRMQSRHALTSPPQTFPLTIQVFSWNYNYRNYSAPATLFWPLVNGQKHLPCLKTPQKDVPILWTWPGLIILPTKKGIHFEGHISYSYPPPSKKYHPNWKFHTSRGRGPVPFPLLR